MTFDREKLLDLRVKSKRGIRLNPEEQQYVEECWRRWPKKYGELEGEVFDRAAQTVNPMWKGKVKCPK